MKISRLVFGKYLACAFWITQSMVLASNCLKAQAGGTEYIINGQFYTSGAPSLDNWTPSGGPTAAEGQFGSKFISQISSVNLSKNF